MVLPPDKTACDYVEVLIRITPIMAVGGITAVITNLSRIAREKTWMRRLFMCLSVVGVGCVAGGIAVLGLTLFIPAPSTELDIVAGAIAGSSGQKVFDIYGRRLFGWNKTRATDAEMQKRQGD